MAILSVSVIDRLRLIVVGAPPSEIVSLAALATGTGGVLVMVGAGAGVGAGSRRAWASVSARVVCSATSSAGELAVPSYAWASVPLAGSV